MIKERLKNLKLNEVFILIFVIFIALVLVLIKLILKDTHAFYDYESGWTPIFNSRAGNFAGEGESVKDGPLTNKNTDINIIFYTQMPDNPDKYKESKYVPATGYKISNEKSNCYPAKGSEATYKDNVYYTIQSDGTVHIEYSETKPTQVVCRLYYDRDKLSDVIIYAYVEDASGDRNYEGKTYKLVNQVESTYKLTTYKCNSKTANTSFNYDATNGFTVTSSGPDTCYAYFSK